MERYPAIRIFVTLSLIGSWIVGGLIVIASLFTGSLFAIISGIIVGALVWLALRITPEVLQILVRISDNTDHLRETEHLVNR